MTNTEQQKRLDQAAKYSHIINRDVLYTGGQEVGKEYYPTTGILAALDLDKVSKKVTEKVDRELRIIGHKKGDY